MDKAKTVNTLRAMLANGPFSQVWAATELEISSQYLNRVLNGLKVPSDDLCKKMDDLIVTLKSSGLIKAV